MCKRKKQLSLRKRRIYFRHQQKGGSLIQLSPGRSTRKVIHFTRNYF